VLERHCPDAGIRRSQQGRLRNPHTSVSRHRVAARWVLAPAARKWQGKFLNAAPQHLFGSCGNLSVEWAKISPNRVKKPNLLANFSATVHISGFGSFLR